MSFAPGANEKRWQPEEDDFVIALYGKWTAKAISDALPRRTQYAVESRVLYLGLEGKGKAHARIGRSERLKAVSMGRKGMSPKLIAQNLGLSRSWVTKVLAEYRKRQAASAYQRPSYPTFDTAEEAIQAAHAIAEQRRSRRHVIADPAGFRVVPTTRKRMDEHQILETVSPIQEAA
ncbi:MAG: hypothetical protein VX796_05910 [Pseudomonadota bacterium]|nr:hypothetical protein [Pseudomonadota bacterium]